ncbi:MAG TPA: Pr6Pr family membrane protein [Acidobacteriaceae bacterium]|jgi:hypothetical protein|nr:Pr6Pr family membrane protein [Acidobacteriaceae bacterium]
MLDIPSNKTMRVTMVSIAILVWFALVLQLFLMGSHASADGRPLFGAVVNYFSFFTILTNLLVAVVLSSPFVLSGTTAGRFFARPTVLAGTAVYIAIVGATYFLLLRHLWNPQGLDHLADVLLHDVVPVTYVLYWLIFVPKAALRWKHALLWLVYPAVYMVYTVAHGAITGWYPYPFIDVAVLGYSHALNNAAGMLLAFLGAGLLVVVIGKFAGRKSAR